VAPPKGTPEYDAWYQKITATSFKKGLVPHNKGKHHTEEAKAKMSAIGKGCTPWNKGIHTGHIPWNKGTHLNNRSSEASARAAESNRGKKRTPEQCAKIGARHKGKLVSAEAREKLSKAGKGRVSNRKGAIIGEETRKRQSESGRKRWERKTEEEKAKYASFLIEGARDITNSSIEDAYAEQLDAQGVIYERQKRIGWYKVDFYVPVENRIIEVNGCYWHGCEQCERIRDDYEEKRKADNKRYEYLRHKGYTVDVVWEHELPRKRSKPP